MKERTLLKIGEFAHLGQVSLATLRHYDQYGLLKPVELDPQTGYRYYALAQLPRLHRIMALKDLGFALPQIAQLLAEDLDLEQLQALFQRKQDHIQEVIALEQERLARVAARLQRIEQEGSMPAHETLLKQVEPALVAALRRPLFVGEDLTPGYERVLNYIEQQGGAALQPHLLLWYSRFEMHGDGMRADVELAVPLRAALPGNEEIGVRTLPGGLMACVVYPGAPVFLGQAFVALHRWLAENSYRLNGPPRQVHLQLAEEPHLAHAVTELQFPVEKTAI